MKIETIRSLLFVSVFSAVLASGAAAGFSSGAEKVASLCEGFSEQGPREDKPVTVFVEFGYDDPVPAAEDQTGDPENPETLEGRRKREKDFYSAMNEAELNELDLSEDGYEISSYSPFVSKRFATYSDYLASRQSLEAVSLDPSVEKVFAEVSPNDSMSSESSHVNSNDNLSDVPEISLETAKEMIGVDSASYNGSGVKIGIIDEGNPSIQTNFANGCIKGTRVSSSSSSFHTSQVASIIGGTTGIAPNADLYIAEFSSYVSGYGLTDCVEWLLDKGVSVINMSMQNLDKGYYDGSCAYVDYIASHDNVAFVKSAGNDETPEHLISDPGMGMNVFTVGSVDGSENVSSYSSYNVESPYAGIITKPTVVAPGDHIVIPNIPKPTGASDGYNSGTSFSAPMVTGTIALLMQEFPVLKSLPSLVMSSIVTGASMIPNQTDLWDEHGGPGILNYPDTENILSGGPYASGAATANLSSGDTVTSLVKTFQPYESVKLCLASMIGSFDSSLTTDPLAPSFTTMGVSIVDESSGSVVASYSSSSNLMLKSFENVSSSPKSFLFKATMNGAKAGSDIESVSLSLTHNHNYSDHYARYSVLYHKAYCSCGKFELEHHCVLPSSETTRNGHTYGTCSLCGQMIDLGTTPVLVG